MIDFVITFADGGEYSARAENKRHAAIIATAERLLEGNGHTIDIHAIHHNIEYPENLIMVPWKVIARPAGT